MRSLASSIPRHGLCTYVWLEAELGERAKRRLVFLILMVTWLMLGPGTPSAAAAPPQEAGVVTAVAGPVTVTRPFASTHLLKVRDGLYWGDVVEAPQDAMAQLFLAQKATVTVRELSRLELRQEALATGVRYVVELLAGKIRMSVDRSLMRPGEQVQVRSRNAVASVRGTDFVVETVQGPPGPISGLPSGPGVIAQEGPAPASETIVYTLSGVVEVTNREGGPAQVVRIGAYEAARVSGGKVPVRVRFTLNDLDGVLKGLTPTQQEYAKSVGNAEPDSFLRGLLLFLILRSSRGAAAR